MLIFGVILIALGIGLYVGSIFKKKRVYELRTTERKNAGDITEMYNEINAEMADFGGSDGTFSEVGEFVGDIACDSPLSSQLGNKPCIHYTMTVKRKYEEKYWDKEANTHKTRTKWDTVSSNKESTRFFVDDGTGKILVDPEGAVFIGLTQSVKKFEAGGQRNSLSFGGFTFSVGSSFMDSGDRRTIGYEYSEQILASTGRLTVIGEATDKMGELAVRKGKESKLTISTKSMEELVESAQKAAKWLMIGGIASGVIGIVLAVVGAVT